MNQCSLSEDPLARVKERLLSKAIKQYTKISPPLRSNSLDDCFILVEDRLVFWFRDQTGDTQILEEDVEIVGQI